MTPHREFSSGSQLMILAGSRGQAKRHAEGQIPEGRTMFLGIFIEDLARARRRGRGSSVRHHKVPSLPSLHSNSKVRVNLTVSSAGGSNDKEPVFNFEATGTRLHPDMFWIHNCWNGLVARPPAAIRTVRQRCSDRRRSGRPFAEAIARNHRDSCVSTCVSL